MKVLEHLIEIGTPVLVWGEPGVGKTAFVQALAKKLDLPIEIVIASLREPSDFNGLPVVSGDGVVFCPPLWAKRLADAGKGLLVLDEINTAPPSVQAALLRVVHERVVGDIALPHAVKIVAIANPVELSTGGWILSPALANRFVHLTWTLNPHEWIASFPHYWGDPPRPEEIGLEATEDEWRQARSLVASFIHRRPHLLLQVPKHEEERGKAWPSPRSWDAASKGLAVAGINGNEDLLAQVVPGAVGEGAGFEFLTWMRTVDLPDPEELLANPSSFKPPKREDLAFAIFTSVVASAVAKQSNERWEAAWEILVTAANHGMMDTAAVAARTLVSSYRERPRVTKGIEVFMPILRAVEGAR